jgi:flagellar basal-body rod protein FlgF/flagellar basal-body rod protein FlgG
MDSGFYSAFTALAARMQSLDLVANNLANANTVGYKGQQEFYKSFSASLNNIHLTSENQAINDFGLIGGARTDFSAGSLNTTGNDTDVAIDGEGFFSVQTKAGVRYTRNGNFRLNAQRQLVDAQGDPVLGEQGPIVVPEGKLTISPDGTISAGDAIVDKLKLVVFSSNAGVVPEGNTDFNVPAENVQPATTVQVRQGSLEASNCDPVSSAVSLINTQRNAELMQRALTIFNTDFNQTAVQELPKT